MPRLPMKPCKYPGCPKLTAGDYCMEHARTVNRQYAKYGRKPEERKRYGRQWRKVRNAYAAKHPLCEMCLLVNRLTDVQEVHHIFPLDHGGTNDEINLMSLCKPCHSRISAKMGDRWSKRTVYEY